MSFHQKLQPQRGTQPLSRRLRYFCLDLGGQSKAKDSTFEMESAFWRDQDLLQLIIPKFQGSGVPHLFYDQVTTCGQDEPKVSPWRAQACHKLRREGNSYDVDSLPSSRSLLISTLCVQEDVWCMNNCCKKTQVLLFSRGSELCCNTFVILNLVDKRKRRPMKMQEIQWILRCQTRGKSCFSGIGQW